MKKRGLGLQFCRGLTDSVSRPLEMQVVTQLGNVREHLKSIMGEEEPIKISSSVYTGVEGEERKLRRRDTGWFQGWVRKLKDFTRGWDRIWLTSTADFQQPIQMGS